MRRSDVPALAMLMSVEGIQRLAWEMFSVKLSAEVAKEYAGLRDVELNIDQIAPPWMDCGNATLVGPAIYLKSRLLERNPEVFEKFPKEEDGDCEIAFDIAKKRGRLRISKVARSKMFTTNLKVVEPIDITTLRVAGTERYKEAFTATRR